MRRDGFYLVDPPVGPFSPLDELRRWRQELTTMPPGEERDEALAQVDQWIKRREGEDGK